VITLINGAVQTANGVANANGWIILQLVTDCQIIAQPGQVVASVPVRFLFDKNGNLLGNCQIWSNAELTPTTQYYVNIYDSFGSRLTTQLWQFNQSNGAIVDIGMMISQQSGPSIAFSTILPNQITVPYTATMAFNGPASGFKTTLAGNVTSSSISGVIAGTIVTFKIIQSASGNNTFSWPANFNSTTPISPTANAASVQSFYYDGTNFDPVGPMTVNPS
jgi:hypothetical protein